MYNTKHQFEILLEQNPSLDIWVLHARIWEPEHKGYALTIEGSTPLHCLEQFRDKWLGEGLTFLEG